MKSYQCLVIQLGSLSDVYQSLMALKTVTLHYPNLKISILCYEENANPFRSVPWIQEVYTIDYSRTISPFLKENKNIHDAAVEILLSLNPLLKSSFDLSVNWTYDYSSSFISGMIKSQLYLGFHRGEDFSFKILDGWSMYIHGTIQNEVKQSIHLIDILTTQLLTCLHLQIGDYQSNEAASVTSKAFFSKIKHTEMIWDWKHPERSWVGISLDSFSENELIEVAKSLAFIVRRHDHINVVLLSEHNKIQFPESIFLKEGGVTDRLLNLSSINDFFEKVKILARCQWLIGKSGSLLNLSSLLGTRVILCAHSQESWLEYAPYGHGHYVIEGELRHEWLYGIFSYATSEWSHQRTKSLSQHFKDLEWSKFLNSISVFRSYVKATDLGGGLAFESLLPLKHTIQLWMKEVVGHIARKWYCGWIPEPKNEITRNQVSPELLKDVRHLRHSLAIIKKACFESIKYCDQLSVESKNVKLNQSLSLEKKKSLKEKSNKVKLSDEVFIKFGEIEPNFKFFSFMMQVMMHNLKGEDIHDLTTSARSSYLQLIEGLEVLELWITETLSVSKLELISTSERLVLQLNKEG